MRSRVVAIVVVIALGVAATLSFRVGALQVVTGSLTGAVTTVQALLSDPARQVGGFVAALHEMGQLRSENARLREEVGRLSAESARLAEVARENDQLREQLNLRQRQSSLQWASARVVGRDASNLVRSLSIDKGSSDGISLGMTVITPAGLVGQITRVGPNASRVLVITDVSSSVTAVVQGSRTDGVVNGTGSPSLLMSYIPLTAVIKTGDRVITSGIGGIFPNGIPIGRVTSVAKKDIETFQEARIDPEVDFRALETVLVITNHVPLRLE